MSKHSIIIIYNIFIIHYKSAMELLLLLLLSIFIYLFCISCCFCFTETNITLNHFTNSSWIILTINCT
eukprot:UN00645